MGAPQPQSDVLTLDEAAAFLRLHRNTLRKLAQDGKVPARKYGAQWRFSRRLLEEHLRERSQPDPDGL
ncbi:hypothetical protein LCGC14_2108170 [marine sediment metagenome]|uniref:Helix-turn-helix domain-containing protein n=1 Tax=marine sediment metagenome TaxID=412755 RepID=A0A0F9EV00_9ZZZZ